MSKLRVGIVGASGYSGEELVRLLLRHPEVELTCITSRQYEGKGIGVAFPRYMESPLTFTAPVAAEVAARTDIVFLALPHGLAAEFAEPLLGAGRRVIDISADFRLRDTAVYAHYYGGEHPAPALLSRAVYGLPEVYREAIRTARLIACPGCYPTSILLPCTALLRAGLAAPDGIAAVCLSGVSGAGRKVDLPYIFPECNESVRPYAITGHRHLPEIEQELSAAAGASVVISFVPHLIPVNRGIHSTILLQAQPGVDAAAVRQCWLDAYGREPFVRVLPPGQLADTKHVTMTNFCEFGCAVDERTGRLLISSAIDNLTKGAAGQAVQNMNIMAGFAEDAGLR